MHAPAAVTAAEQEGCKALAVRVREDGYLGRLVCGGGIGNSRLCSSSAKAAIQRAKTGKRKHHQTTDRQASRRGRRR
jgi:hypothetical protein